MKTQRHHSITRLLSLALVFLLALTVAVPVFAADDQTLTITINNAPGLNNMVDNQFTAYQIFKGKANKDGEKKENEWDATEWNNWTLADIQWGDDINTPQTLVEAIGKATKEDWPEFWPEPGTQNVFDGITYSRDDPAASAEKVADILVKNDNNAFLQAFSEFVVHGQDTRGQKGRGYVQNGVKSKAAGDHSKSTITVKAQGYYLIAEDHALNQGAESEFILAVLGDQTINLKADVPTVDKNIVTATDPKEETSKGDAAGVGDKVTFRLTGTVAKNIDTYKTYKYVFTDKLSKGLTYQKDAKVYLKRGEQNYAINGGYTVTPVNEEGPVTTLPGGDTTIKIDFTDLKTITVPDLADFGGIKAGDEIIVEYTAVLNENSVIGSTGNLNDVKLTYSNDPHSDSTGETTTTEVHVFSFGLDLKKVGSDEPDQGLRGASFVLKKEEGGVIRYAKFKDQWILTKDGVQTFYDTKGGADSASTELQGTVTGPIRRLTEWVEKTTYDSEIVSDGLKSHYLLTSGEGGAIPDVYGLDEGKYALEEVVTPDGYNTMKDLSITIAAKFNEVTGDLESVTYTGSDGRPQEYDSANNGTEGPTKGVFSSGLLPDTLVNQKAPLLPFTGGIGTVIFYVVGGLLVAGAVTYIVIASKKRKKIEENA